MDQIKIIRVAAVSGMLCVALGAFGAHSLDKLVESGKLTPSDLDIFETGVRYQFYHTFALLALACIPGVSNPKQKKYSAIAFLTGIIIFSGSLYILSLSEFLFGTRLSILGAITPLGGLAFITGWLFLFLSTTKK